jgi:hypothetical protein
MTGVTERNEVVAAHMLDQIVYAAPFVKRRYKQIDARTPQKSFSRPALYSRLIATSWSDLYAHS